MIPQCRCGHRHGQHQALIDDGQPMIGPCRVCTRCPRYRMPPPDSPIEALEERLLDLASGLALDIRDDRDAAHRTVRHLDRLELEQLCCVLAAGFPVDLPLSQLAWWRFLAKGDAA